MNPENGKKTYESIEIPKNLNETVMQTIASKNKEELKMKYESNENKKARQELWDFTRPKLCSMQDRRSSVL